MTRPSQVARILAAHQQVGAELRHGTLTTVARAVAVLYAAQRNASNEEIHAADGLRLAELRGVPR